MLLPCYNSLMQALQNFLSFKNVSILLLLFLTASFLLKTDRSFDQDFGRHLLIGKIILETGEVPLTNLFSYTYPDFPFINSHWLFEVLIYLGQQAIGLQVLLFLKVTVLLLAVWFVLKTIPKNQYLILPVSFIFLHLVRERTDFRPEILSFLFTGLTIYILHRFEKEKSRLIFFLPIVQLLWVNSHIYFVVGIFIQLIYLFHFTILKNFKQSRWILAVTLSSIALSLINPSGIKGALNPFLYNTNYGYTIAENQNMFLLESINFTDPNFLFVKVAVIIALLSVFTSLLRGRFSFKNLGLIGLGAGLALLNIRSFPYLFLISLPGVLENFGGTKITLAHKILITVSFFLLIFESLLYLNGDYYKYKDKEVSAGFKLEESGQKAMDFVLSSNLPQPIFNNFDIGSYITYRGYPKYRIFVDGRPGEYPKEFFQDVYIPAQEDPEKFKQSSEKYNFQTIIFSHTDQTPWAKNFFKFISSAPDWKTVYLDDFMVILVKSEVASDMQLNVLDLDKISPEEFNFKDSVSYSKISLFLLNTNHINRAKVFAEKAVEIFPESPIGNLLLAQFQPATTNIFELQKINGYIQKSKTSIWW